MYEPAAAAKKKAVSSSLSVLTVPIADHHHCAVEDALWRGEQQQHDQDGQARHQHSEAELVAVSV